MKRQFLTRLALGILLISCHASFAQLAFDDPEMTDENLDSQVFSAPSPINITEVQSAIQYPDAAQKEGIEGEVICKVLINKNGSYLKHKITSSPNYLGEAVDPHLARLRFTPAIKNGKKIPVWTTVQFAFSLAEDGVALAPQKTLQNQEWEQSAAAMRVAGDYSKASEVLKNAIVLTDEESLPKLLNETAQVSMLARNYADARIALTNLYHQLSNPLQKAEVLQARAVCALLNNQFGQAARDLARSHNLAPNYFPELSSLQRYLALSDTQIQEAVQSLQEFSAGNSSPISSYLALRVVELDQ